jgi:hypothetical protein
MEPEARLVYLEEPAIIVFFSLGQMNAVHTRIFICISHLPRACSISQELARTWKVYYPQWPAQSSSSSSMVLFIDVATFSTRWRHTHGNKGNVIQIHLPRAALPFVTKQIGSSDHASDLYFEEAWFESWPRCIHWDFLMYVGFLSTTPLQLLQFFS